MKIIVFGGTGTIGTAFNNLLKDKHEIISVGKSRGAYRVDVEDIVQLRQFFDKVGEVDGIISMLGNGQIIPFDDALEEDYQSTLTSKLFNNIRIYHEGKQYVKKEGFMIFTSGLANINPMKGASPIAVACSAIETFVTSAFLEETHGIRLNVVSPAVVKETMLQFGLDSKGSISALDTAKVYLQLIEEKADGLIARVPDYLLQTF